MTHATRVQQTFGDLRKMGFSIQRASDAQHCTEVVFPEPFYYCALFRSDSTDEIRKYTELSMPTAGGHRLLFNVVFDDYGDRLELPYRVFTSEHKARMDAALERHRRLLEDLRNSAKDCLDVFDAFAP